MSKKRIRIGKKDDGLDPRLKAFIQHEVDKQVAPYKDKFEHSHLVMMEVAKFLHGMLIIFEDLESSAQLLITSRGTVTGRLQEYADNISMSYQNIKVLMHTVKPLAALYAEEDEEIKQIYEELEAKIQNRELNPFDTEDGDILWDDIIERRNDGTTAT